MMSLSHDIAWLVGFWDGEGHISVHSSTKSKEKVWYQATMGLRNTHQPSVQYVCDLLDDLGVTYSLIEEERSKVNRRHKDSYWLNVTGMKNIILLLSHMKPYWVTKREQAMLIDEYCRSRLVAKPKSGYSIREREIQTIFKTINKRGT